MKQKSKCVSVVVPELSGISWSSSAAEIDSLFSLPFHAEYNHIRAKKSSVHESPYRDSERDGSYVV